MILCRFDLSIEENLIIDKNSAAEQMFSTSRYQTYCRTSAVHNTEIEMPHLHMAAEHGSIVKIVLNNCFENNIYGSIVLVDSFLPQQLGICVNVFVQFLKDRYGLEQVSSELADKFPLYFSAIRQVIQAMEIRMMEIERREAHASLRCLADYTVATARGVGVDKTRLACLYEANIPRYDISSMLANAANLPMAIMINVASRSYRVVIEPFDDLNIHDCSFAHLLQASAEETVVPVALTPLHRRRSLGALSFIAAIL